MATFCVVGAGVIGLSSALCIAKRFHGCKITILYDERSPDLTSNHAFGMCGATLPDDTDCSDYMRWVRATAQHLDELKASLPTLEGTGLHECDMFAIHLKDELEKTDYTDVWEACRFSCEATPEEVKKVGFKAAELEYVLQKKDLVADDLYVRKNGIWVVDGDAYLPWTLNQLNKMEERGEISELRVIKRKISHFSDVFDDGSTYDCIINCSGLGAKYLVPDQKMVPMRGQYLTVEADDITDMIWGETDHALSLICPLPGRLKVGGTHQRGRSDITPDPNDTRDILKRCEALCPRLRGGRIIKECVGIRPARIGGARVELEFRKLLPNSRLIPIVHNYGHGSKGYLQHWGCAMDVAVLAEKAVMKKSNL